LNYTGTFSGAKQEERSRPRHRPFTVPRIDATSARRGEIGHCKLGRTFLRNHMEGIASIDLFVVPTIAFQQLYAFLVLGHRRRQLLWFAVTQNPTAEWLARQITEAFPWDSAPKSLIRDNDRAFGVAFKERIRAMGIRDRPTSYHSPWQNGYVERLIGSIRRECLDHLIIFNAEHLRRILEKYATYYNEVRAHVSLGKDAPCRRPIERFGDIVSYPILGGLHHRYARI
jgi:transposase InsO family protein